MTPAELVRVAALEELEGDGPHARSAGGLDVVIVRAASGLRAFEGRCPHQGALLGEGELEGDRLVCRNHRWRFSVETGQRDGGPECLAACPVTLRDGSVFVDVARLAHGPERRAAKRTLDDLPGPRGLPLLGNTLQLDLTRLHQVLEEWAGRYGSVYLFRMGPVPVVAITEPSWCEAALRARPEVFTRHSGVAPVFSEMGVAGVFSAEGEAWRPQRRLAMQALAQRHLRGLYPSLRLVAARLKKRWQGLADAGAPLDIVEDLKRFTVDVTTLITFGHDVNTVDQGEDRIQRRLEHVFPAFNRRLFALFPTWRLLRLPRDRRLDRALAELRAWLGELVVAARARLAAQPERAERPANFLEAMLSARDDEGRPFSQDVIFGNLMTMLLAGEDTTAYTLGWAVHELCDSPDSVLELRREAESAFGAGDLAHDLDTVNELAWAGAVANETMRLRPVAPVQILDASVDTVLGDLSIPRGTRIAILSRPAARDPERFADAHVFRPLRWLAETGAHDPSAHIPFGSGPRICPGRTLALVELKLVLSMLYKNFDVERAGDAGTVQERFAFTMAPLGLQVRLRRRESAAVTASAPARAAGI